MNTDKFINILQSSDKTVLLPICIKEFTFDELLDVIYDYYINSETTYVAWNVQSITYCDIEIAHVSLSHSRKIVYFRINVNVKRTPNVLVYPGIGGNPWVFRTHPRRKGISNPAIIPITNSKYNYTSKPTNYFTLSTLTKPKDKQQIVNNIVDRLQDAIDLINELKSTEET